MVDTVRTLDYMECRLEAEPPGGDATSRCLDFTSIMVFTLELEARISLSPLSCFSLGYFIIATRKVAKIGAYRTRKKMSQLAFGS